MWITSEYVVIHSRGRQATRTLSTAFPNSRSRTPPPSATGIRADARAYTPARDGGLREKACSTAFPGQPAKAEPSRPCETSRRGPHNRRALQLSWNLQVRSCKPDPLGADIVHVRENCRNGAGPAGWFSFPGGGVKMFDKNLVHAIIGGKDLDCGSAE